jgi:hypothetical protein
MNQSISDASPHTGSPYNPPSMPGHVPLLGPGVTGIGHPHD